MVDLGFSLQPQYSLPTEMVIDLLAVSGFSAVSPVWSPELDLTTLSACIKKHTMQIQSLHAPHRGIPLLWQPDDANSLEVQNSILRCIQDCNQFQIPVMVIHGWQGLVYTFPKEPLDFRFFDRMVEYARQQGVLVAFENLEGEEYLKALLTRYREQSHIGFCWDSGHDHCYPHTLDFLNAFGDRLIMTHINDNLGLRDPAGIPSGEDDLHLLPFDGTINWQQAIRMLKTAPKQAILNFEIKIQSKATVPEKLLYTRQSPEVFFQTAGIRARQIARLYEQA